ncbi:MAG: proton-conducting transporter membrane subunit [Rhodospirillaceae bacterium]
MHLLALVILPFAASLLAACLRTNARNAGAWLAGSAAFAGLLIAGSLYPQVRDGGVTRLRLPWMPAQGVDFVVRMDALAWVFAMLVLGIGVLVVLYARYYLSPTDPVARFFAFLLAFMGSMLGLVLSGNLIQLVLFWELTSLTSFLLIGYWHHRADARRGARMALIVTAAGGLCLLVGVLMLGRIVGSYDLDAVLAAGDAVRASTWYRPALVLVALGAFTKSAQFPFHFWLPHAMAAPTPVSAYLHSATMVKAGVFILMRLWPVLSGTPEWHWVIGGAGVCTMLLGAFVAIFQHDLKGLLAYSTISHLGLITVLLGIGSPLGMVAAVFHTLNHATFKASLFMAAGIVDHETGTRDMRVLRGLYRSMPVTGTLAIVASAAMAGVPLMNGFLSKEMFFAETALVGGSEDWSMSVAAAAARAAALDAVPGRGSGAAVPGGGRRAGSERATGAHRRGARGPGRAHAGLRPRPLARFQPAADAERPGAGRRRAVLPPAAAPLRAADERREAAAAPLQWRAGVRDDAAAAGGRGGVRPALAGHAAHPAAAAARRGGAGRAATVARASAPGRFARAAIGARCLVRRDVAGGRRLRRRRGLAGEVPPRARAHPRERHRHRHEHDLPLAVGP